MAAATKKHTDSKESFLERIAFQLGEWDAQLLELIEDSKKAGAESKEKYEAQINGIRASMEEARKRLEEYRSTGTEAWHDVKMGAEKAWIDMKHGLTDAFKKFK